MTAFERSAALDRPDGKRNDGGERGRREVSRMGRRRAFLNGREVILEPRRRDDGREQPDLYRVTSQDLARARYFTPTGEEVTDLPEHAGIYGDL